MLCQFWVFAQAIFLAMKSSWFYIKYHARKWTRKEWGYLDEKYGQEKCCRNGSSHISEHGHSVWTSEFRDNLLTICLLFLNNIFAHIQSFIYSEILTINSELTIFMCGHYKCKCAKLLLENRSNGVVWDWLRVPSPMYNQVLRGVIGNEKAIDLMRENPKLESALKKLGEQRITRRFGNQVSIRPCLQAVTISLNLLLAELLAMPKPYKY